MHVAASSSRSCRHLPAAECAAAGPASDRQDDARQLNSARTWRSRWRRRRHASATNGIPPRLADEIGASVRQAPRRPPLLVIVDEVQKVPALMDVAQDLIDRRQARFVFNGSSARKLRRGRDLNLLPGVWWRSAWTP